MGSIDRRIGELAGRQHGVVSRPQLLALGLGEDAIDHRARLARLHVIHPGVYAVGHRVLTQRGRWIAAVLAAGEGAVLSHHSAGALWGLLPPTRMLELTSPSQVRRPGIRAHQSHLPADETATEDGIPVTTVARTLLDLAAVVDPRRLERALEEADKKRLDEALSLPDLIRRYPGRRGVARARLVLARFVPGATLTRSELEERFLSFLDERELPCRARG